MKEDGKGGLILSRQEYEQIMRECKALKDYYTALRDTMSLGFAPSGKKLPS